MAFVPEREKRGYQSRGMRLRKAARTGDISTLCSMISSKANLESSDEYNNTALVLASEASNAEIVEELLKAKARVNARDKYGQSALFHAVGRGNAWICDLLLKAGADTNNVTKFGQTALMKAAYTIHHHTKYNIDNLLEKKADPNLQDMDGRTAASICAETNKLRCLQSMILKKAKVDTPDKEGLTPLMVAAKYANYELIEFLVAMGANIDHKNSKGDTVKDVTTRMQELAVEDTKHNKSLEDAIKSGVEILEGKKKKMFGVSESKADLFKKGVKK